MSHPAEFPVEKTFSREVLYMSSDPSISSYEPACGRSSWKKAFIYFSETTTLHGLKHIWRNGSYRIRKLIWLLLVLTGLGLMCFQIIDRILHYRSWPANVNVQINFSDNLHFPAITICNQNLFKATAAAADNRYRLIEAIHTQSGNFTPDDLQAKYNASDILADNLMLRAAHRKEDFIVNCQWEKTPCLVSDFTQTITDHGVCFTFNNKKSNRLQVTNAGSDFGLRLVLNVEQYEYMPGPHGAAGVKIFIHDQDEFPLVGELGLAIPTGSHSFVGNSFFVLENLPPPHGECGKKKLDYFSEGLNFTSSLCRMDCVTREMTKQCGCRQPHLPHVNGEPRVCTLKEIYECAIPFMSGFHKRQREVCQCPVPCTFQHYPPSVSQSSTSSFAIDKLLASINTEELMTKYTQAREVTHRFESDKFIFFGNVLNDVHDKLKQIETLLREEISSKLQEQQKAMGTLKERVYASWAKKHKIYTYQIYDFQKNFLRGRDAMEERTLNEIADGFQGFALDVRAKLNFLVEADVTENCTRDNVYLLLKDKLNVEIEIIDRGIDNLTQLIDAFETGKPIFTYVFSKNTREDNLYVVPKKLLKDSLTWSWSAREQGLKTPGHLIHLQYYLQGYLNLTDTAYYNKTLDGSDLLHVENGFLLYNKRYFSNRANLYTESIERPLIILKDRQADFTALWDRFETDLDNMHGNVNIIHTKMKVIQEDFLSNFDHINELGQAYLVNSSIAKLGIANAVIAPHIQQGINTMKVFFTEVRSRGQTMFDTWTKLGQITSDIWRKILRDEYSHDFYVWKGIADFLENETVVVQRETTLFKDIRDRTDIRNVIGNKDDALYLSIANLVETLNEFVTQTKLDEKFLKDNFVFLDVYYSQLSYEQITQQEEYGLFPLMCDIGGSLGLFLGASALSLFEIVDLIVNQAFQQILNVKMPKSST